MWNRKSFLTDEVINLRGAAPVMDATKQFQNAIITHGWNPGAIVADGKIHRFEMD
jgi:hypothetical protein